MRNTLLALIICTLPIIAAEQKRDWQSGQVVESKAQVDPRIHTIAAADKNYFVRGTPAGTEDALVVGATVRFAVEGTTMFVSVSGKEYRLSVMGATVRTSSAPVTPPPPTAAAAQKAPVAPPAAPAARAAPVAPPPPTAAAVQAAPVQKPANPSELVLDNDAIVKMTIGGLKEDTVISVIQARRGQYVLSSDATLALKAAGVPQSIIDAMSAKMKTQH